MIGIYDYTVILTYLSLLISTAGMMLSTHGRFKLAVTCLALSGFCDMFDGKVARTKKNRTSIEKGFGIQLDSLCDIVSFGVAPALLCYQFCMQDIFGIVILMFYTLAGLIRLAWFNVMEEQRQRQTDSNRKTYQGLPITSIALILPVAMVLITITGINPVPLLHAVMLATGFFFILDFEVRKPQNKTLVIFALVVAAALIGIHFFKR